MKILKENEGKLYSIKTKELNLEDISSLNNLNIKKILNILSKKEMYPKEIAKLMGIHEQNVYYYIRKLEKSNLIFIKKEKEINGSIAKYYGLISDSFFFKFKDFKEQSKITHKESDFLKPFIEDYKMNSLIVVGSPDPHGPQKARSRDGYFGMDLALFLGSFIEYNTDLKIRLDTEITEKELSENNLIVLGGPIVNKISMLINPKMPIRFDIEKKGIFSSITNKIYFEESFGILNKIRNPFNSEKSILFIGGMRNSGTKAVILSFLKNFKEIKKPNIFNSNHFSKIIEGVDLDSDGKIDSIEIIE